MPRQSGRRNHGPAGCARTLAALAPYSPSVRGSYFPTAKARLADRESPSARLSRSRRVPCYAYAVRNTQPTRLAQPPVLDLLFRVIGTEVPADHGYALFGAISRILESDGDRWLHGNAAVGLHTIRGVPGAPGRYLLGEGARFGLRLPPELVARSLALAGRSVELDGCRLRVGVAHTRALMPATTLRSRVVTTRNGLDPARFDSEIARQAAALDIHGRIFRVPRRDERGSAGRDPSRRVVRIRDKRVVGYSLLATELTAEESIRLQEHGLGGRRRMGCGVFVPFQAPPPRRRGDARVRSDR